jgi:hypothetical protein
MTTYKDGQTAKITFRDGSYAVGTVRQSSFGVDYYIQIKDRALYVTEGTVEILAEPKIEEPTRVGAVVSGRHFTTERFRFTLASDGRWYREKNGNWLWTTWDSINDPEILWEGPEC